MSRKIYVVASHCFPSTPYERNYASLGRKVGYIMAPGVFEVDVRVSESDDYDADEEHILAILNGSLSFTHVRSVIYKQMGFNPLLLGAYFSRKKAEEACDKQAAAYHVITPHLGLVALRLKMEADVQEAMNAGFDLAEGLTGAELSRFMRVMEGGARIVGASIEVSSLDEKPEGSRHHSPFGIPVEILQDSISRLERSLLYVVEFYHVEQAAGDWSYSPGARLDSFIRGGAGENQDLLDLFGMTAKDLETVEGVYRLGDKLISSGVSTVFSSERLTRRIRTRPIYPQRWRPWQAHIPEGGV